MDWIDWHLIGNIALGVIVGGCVLTALATLIRIFGKKIA